MHQYTNTLMYYTWNIDILFTILLIHDISKCMMYKTTYENITSMIYKDNLKALPIWGMCIW
jgi:hypothetical protein